MSAMRMYIHGDKGYKDDGNRVVMVNSDNGNHDGKI